jgi:transposase
MNETTCSESSSVAAFVALDWGDQRHAGMLSTGGDTAESFEVEQTPEALDLWVAGLRKRFAGALIAVALEQSKGALVYALLKYDLFVLYPVNPKQLARFREALAPSGAKDDPSDAALLLELLIKHRQHLRPWRPDDSKTRLIGQLAEDRRHLVENRTRLVNALKARLKQYFPLALEALGELDTELASQFLLRWGSLEELQREEPQEIAAFYRLWKCRHPRLIDERLQKIASATPLVTDPAIVHSGRMMAHSLAAQLLALVAPIEDYDRQLAKLMDEHSDAGIFRSFPGAGPALAPRLLAAFGTDRSRLNSANQVQSYSGIAPVMVRSGSTHQVHRRWACNKFLRQTFHEFAGMSLRNSAWAKAYYDQMRARGAKHQAAIRALAFKWIRILFHCWQARTHYNEVHYFQQLYRKQSPLLKFMGSQSGAQPTK